MGYGISHSQAAEDWGHRRSWLKLLETRDARAGKGARSLGAEARADRCKEHKATGRRRTLVPRYEGLRFEDVQREVIHLFPAPPAQVLDVGAGTGRDAEALEY